jgi:hypothetical protein
MVAMVADQVLDNGLINTKALADKIYLCTADPADFTGATSTYAAGNKNFGAGNALTGPAASTSPTGRKLTTVAIPDGTVTATVTAAKWAVVDSANSHLLVNGALAASQAVTSGNTFTLAAFDIKIADQ